jgi:hypothetical protein
MKEDTHPARLVRSFLRGKKIATLDDLKDALDTNGTMTVFRKLKELGYLSSYSHRGKYYTLNEIPKFDKEGLWSQHSVWFSRYGNLIETAKEFIEESDDGFSSSELKEVLHVECKRALLTLYRAKRIHREVVAGVQVYFSKETRKCKKQERVRISASSSNPASQTCALSDELRAAIILFVSLLDEKQRRLYAGLESHKLGYGGDVEIASLLGVDVHMVARGRRELLSNNVETGQIRQKGGGRKRAEKKRTTDYS